MAEEQDLSAAIAAAQARLERAHEEARQAAAHLAELSRKAASLAAAAQAPPPPVPAPIAHIRDTRLHRGGQADRVRVMAQATLRLAQPFTLGDVVWLTRLTQRTVERRLTAAVRMGLLVRTRKGRYRNAPAPPAAR